MPQWTAEQEAEFKELCRRAAEQSRALAGRAPPQAAPAVEPPHPGECGWATPAPAAPVAGGQQPGIDKETLLLLLVLAFLVSQKADRELVWALLYVLLF